VTRSSWLPATGSEIEWPEPPEDMSYSTLQGLESCPRQWALQRAEYPDVWARHGYPPRFSTPAASGRIVHSALERLVKNAANGDDAEGDDAVATALRELGGFTALIRSAIADELQSQAENPRAAPRLERARIALEAQLPRLRQQVQSQVARLAGSLPLSRHVAHSGAGGHPGNGLGNGAFPEVTLRSDELHWKGIADLLTIEGAEIVLTDFKTGVVDSTHEDQLRIYALLWQEDERLNPQRRRATSLRISYAGEDVVVDVPPPDEMHEMRDALASRTSSARLAAVAEEPDARTDGDTCFRCSVRHLCEVYWSTFGPLHTRVAGDYQLVDAELTIATRHGVRSFVGNTHAGAEPVEIMVRVSDDTELAIGRRVRVLAALYDEPEDGPITVTLTSQSEVFTLAVT
jgi:hypothetical protein